MRRLTARLLVPALLFAAGCAATEEDPLDPSTRLAELEALDAAPATPAELEAARLWIADWIVALRSPRPTAEADWKRRAGRPPAAKVLAALVERRDPCLAAASPGGLPGIYLARLATGDDRLRLEPALLALLGDPDPRWRVYGLEVLGHWPTGRVHGAVLDRLDDGHPDVAVAAASALAQRGDPTGLPRLLAVARAWSDDGARGPLPFRHHFTRFSGADFGDDFEAYDAWFALHPAR